METEILNMPKNEYAEVSKSELLTNLQFLEDGQPWPPTSQLSRLRRYRLNKSKFDNKLEINKKAYDYIVSLVNDRFRVVSYRMLINFYRKVTYKTADLLFVERPQYLTKVGNQDNLNEIVSLSKLGKIGYEGAEDVSIYGDSIYTIKIPDSYEDEETGEIEQSKARISITNPMYWFPVADERDLKEIKYHVIAHIVTRIIIDSNNKQREQNYLIYQVHERGSYTQFERVLNNDGTLGEKVIFEDGSYERKIETGLSDFAIVPTSGVTTSDSIFGIDDYTDIINLIDELQIRLEKIAHVLDKHSDPSLSGPAEALQFDPESGEYYLKLGDYFQRNTKESPEVEYITWDGKLESSFKEIELIIDLLSIITEMGSAIFDRDNKGGGELSGRALKLLYVNPLTKVSRVRNNFDDAFKTAISLCSEVGYSEKLEKKDISIIWNDGLPGDPIEDAEVAAIRTGQKPTDTVSAQIQKLDGLSEAEANKKADLIAIEESAQLPAFGLPFTTPTTDLINVEE